MQNIQSILITDPVEFFGQYFLHGRQAATEWRGGDHATLGALALDESGPVLENHNAGGSSLHQSPSWKRPWKHTTATDSRLQATMANCDRPDPIVNGMLRDRRVFDREQALCVK